eukprot:2564292-Rhodomonas_salina.1
MLHVACCILGGNASVYGRSRACIFKGNAAIFGSDNACVLEGSLQPFSTGSSSAISGGGVTFRGAAEPAVELLHERGGTKDQRPDGRALPGQCHVRVFKFTSRTMAKSNAIPRSGTSVCTGRVVACVLILIRDQMRSSMIAVVPVPGEEWFVFDFAVCARGFILSVASFLRAFARLAAWGDETVDNVAPSASYMPPSGTTLRVSARCPMGEAVLRGSLRAGARSHEPTVKGQKVHGQEGQWSKAAAKSHPRVRSLGTK